MLAVIFIYLLCEYSLPINGWLTYTVFRSEHNPNSLKLQIDGDIHIEGDSGSKEDKNILRSALKDSTEERFKEKEVELKENTAEEDTYTTDTLTTRDDIGQEEKSTDTLDVKPQYNGDKPDSEDYKENMEANYELVNDITKENKKHRIKTNYLRTGDAKQNIKDRDRVKTNENIASTEVKGRDEEQEDINDRVKTNENIASTEVTGRDEVQEDINDRVKTNENIASTEVTGRDEVQEDINDRVKTNENIASTEVTDRDEVQEDVNDRVKTNDNIASTEVKGRDEVQEDVNDRVKTNENIASTEVTGRDEVQEDINEVKTNENIASTEVTGRDEVQEDINDRVKTNENIASTEVKGRDEVQEDVNDRVKTNENIASTEVTGRDEVQEDINEVKTNENIASTEVTGRDEVQEDINDRVKTNENIASTEVKGRDEVHENIKDRVKTNENSSSAELEIAALKDKLISIINLVVGPGTDKTDDAVTERGEDEDHAQKQTIMKNDEDQLVPNLRAGNSSEVAVTRMATHKPGRHKVQNDAEVRKFTEHVYKQTLQAFEQMKKNSDPYTQMQIDSMAKMYKKKFTEFVMRTRQTDIKTSQGTRNVMMHTLDTSNLILMRVMNFLKSEIIDSDSNVPPALREGGALRIDKEVDNVRETEYEHACKKFGVCRSSEGFRMVIQDLISMLLRLPDDKLLQANDAATEVLRNTDLSTIADSVSSLYLLNRAIKIQERTDPNTLRNNLGILYGVLSKSHLPLIVEKEPYARPAVKRTVSFRRLLDALEAALPPTESNKQQWGLIRHRLGRWVDDSPVSIQEVWQLLVDNIQKGFAKNLHIKTLVEEVVENDASIGAF